MTQEDAWNELRETITELRDNDGTCTQQETCKFLCNLMGVLDKQITDGWISASEKLPRVMDGSNGECSDDVLICVADDEHTTISTGFYGYYPNTPSQQGWWSMWAYGCHQLDRKYKVIAWMPLPTSYQCGTNMSEIPTSSEMENEK